MGIYISSRGEQKNTEEMDLVYIERALSKARQNNDEDNIKSLELELTSRGEATDDNTIETQEEDTVTEDTDTV